MDCIRQTANRDYKITRAYETLREFNPVHELQVALFTLMAQRLVVREAQEGLAEVFFAMDQDGDGVISEQDFNHSYEIYYGQGSE